MKRKPIVAHVGADSPMNPNDIGRVCLSMTHAPDLPRLFKLDIVNLHNGRDFLAEDKTYDAVVVHSVFHSHGNMLELARKSTIAHQISPLHSEEKWAERLVSTKARIIVVLETIPYSLNGWQLGDLPGYKISHRDGQITVYEKMEEEEARDGRRSNSRQNQGVAAGR